MFNDNVSNSYVLLTCSRLSNAVAQYKRQVRVSIKGYQKADKLSCISFATVPPGVVLHFYLHVSTGYGLIKFVLKSSTTTLFSLHPYSSFKFFQGSLDSPLTLRTQELRNETPTPPSPVIVCNGGFSLLRTDSSAGARKRKMIFHAWIISRWWFFTTYVLSWNTICVCGGLKTTRMCILRPQYGRRAAAKTQQTTRYVVISIYT